MTEEEKSSFLSLVERFLSWRNEFLGWPGYFFSVRFFEIREDAVQIRYEPYGCLCTGMDFRDCAKKGTEYMERLTGTKSPEELDLFLSSEGFL